MGAYLAQRVVKLIAASGQQIIGARVGILGFTFKENVPDIRNSKVVDIYKELRAFGARPMVNDPLADADTVRRAYGVELTPLEDMQDLCALVLAVSHREYVALGPKALGDMVAANGIVVDVKADIDPGSLREDIEYWSL
jgi:UDP-N-acetyl-D-galactosamine dehydrogenase